MEPVLNLTLVVQHILNMKRLNNVNLFVQNDFCSINNIKWDTKSFFKKLMNEVKWKWMKLNDNEVTMTTLSLSFIIWEIKKHGNIF